MKMHPASCAVTKLELYFHDLFVSRATGFLYNNGQDMGLVTNWHVFAGKHAGSRVILNRDGLVPDRVRLHITKAVRVQGGVDFSFEGLELPLTAEGKPLWWQHPGYVNDASVPQIVDIAVLPLNGLLEDFDKIKKSIQSFENQVIIQPGKDPTGKDASDWTYQQASVRVGSEVFILGYPLGLSSQGVMPIWKRGSLASEPLFNIQDNIPIMYVDAATRGGMSGSPVLYLGRELLDEQGWPAAERGENDDPWLLGVYSGRTATSQDELDMGLGRVWRKVLLDRIFATRVVGGSDPTGDR